MGSDFSTERGSFPKEVFACFESRACARAVSPAKKVSSREKSKRRVGITSESEGLGLFFLSSLAFFCHDIQMS